MANGQFIQVQAGQAGLSNGIYTGTVTITAVDLPNTDPLSIPVQLRVVEELFDIYMPLIEK